jgi:hypothetical protein
MSYLTYAEKKMPVRIMLLQVVLGLQTCKTKGEAATLLKEVYDLARRRGFKAGCEYVRDDI